MDYLEPLDLIDINQAETGVTGGTVVDLGLVYAAAKRPRAFVAGEEAYPDVFTKAAALLHAVAAWHPFAEKNFQTAVTAAFILCELNGVAVQADDAEGVALADAASSGAVGVVQIAEAIKRWSRPIQ